MHTSPKLAIAGLILAHAPLAHAQAWVDEPNSLSASFGYTFAFSNRIVETQGVDLKPVSIQHHVFNIGLEYVTPLDGLAISAGLPMVLATWEPREGDAGGQFGPHGPWDDGKYHFRPTDFRIGARYNVLNFFEELPVAASIIFAGSVPTGDYPNQGFVAPGRNLWKLHFGAAIGSTFAPVLPNLYVHGQYEFAFVQRLKTDDPATEEYVQDHSDVSFQIGYFILESLEVHAALDARIAHGGFDFLDWEMVSQTVRDFHDPLLRETVLQVGGGASYSVVDWFAIDILFRIFAVGTNTRDAHLVGLGLSFQIL